MIEKQTTMFNNMDVFHNTYQKELDTKKFHTV